MIDKIMDIVMAVAIAAFFIGIMIAIWAGIIGVKIFSSGIVLFVADCVVFFLITIQKKDKHRGRSGEHGKEK